MTNTFGLGGGSERFLFNRFGDELNLIHYEIDSKVKAEILEIVKTGTSEMKKALKTVQDHGGLDTRLSKIESTINIKPHHIGFNSKRLVGVAKAIDKYDVVNKVQLDESISEMKRVTNVFDASKPDVLVVHKHRRIGKVGKSKDPHDVVVRTELTDLNNTLVTFQTNLNTILLKIRSDISELQKPKAGINISDKDAASENPGQRVPNDIPSGTPYPPQ
jgi:hypothetical protein